MTRADIARVAYARLQTTSPRELHMKDIADDLGVRTPSLYYHVVGKEDVLNLVRDEIASMVDSSILDIHPVSAALLALAHGYVDIFRPLHPEAATALFLLPYGDQPLIMAMYENFTQKLAECGVPVDERLPIIVALESFCVGMIMDERAPTNYMAPTDPATAPWYAEAYAAAPDRSARALSLGIEAMVAGLVVRYPQLGGMPD